MIARFSVRCKLHCCRNYIAAGWCSFHWLTRMECNEAHIRGRCLPLKASLALFTGQKGWVSWAPRLSTLQGKGLRHFIVPHVVLMQVYLHKMLCLGEEGLFGMLLRVNRDKNDTSLHKRGTTLKFPSRQLEPLRILIQHKQGLQRTGN